MIQYEELCEALARWRSRQGLMNGPSARPPQGAVVAPPPALGSTPAFAPGKTDEHDIIDQPTAITPNPLLAAAAEGDGPTAQHAAAPVAVRPVQEHTNEIDLDADNVLLDDDL